jgi:hypothetical protein
MIRQKCWVWFKGGLQEPGRWVTGYVATSSDAGGFLIQHPEYVDCRVPEWRVSTSEPVDLEQGPAIPTNAEWRLF